MIEPLLTVQEAAGILRLSLPTLYRLVKAGELPAYRIGKLRLAFKADDLIRYVNERATL